MRNGLRFATGVAGFLLATSVFALPQHDPFVPRTAPTNEVSAVLDVRPRNNMPLVRATVNGKPCTLLFDTGASHTTLDLGFVTNALPDVALQEIQLGGSTNVRTRPRCFEAESLTLGDAAFGRFTMMVLGLGHLSAGVGVRVDGILGMNVIGRVPSVLSLHDRRATFNPSDTNGFGRAVRGLPQSNCFRLLARRVAAGPDAAPIPLLIDSGASFTFLPKGLWTETEATQELNATQVNGADRTQNGIGAEGEIDLGMPVRIKPMIYAQPAGLLGADTLLNYDILMSFPDLRFKSR